MRREYLVRTGDPIRSGMDTKLRDRTVVAAIAAGCAGNGGTGGTGGVMGTDTGKGALVAAVVGVQEKMSAEELATLTQYPANLIGVPFQNNTNFNYGPREGFPEANFWSFTVCHNISRSMWRPSEIEPVR